MLRLLKPIYAFDELFVLLVTINAVISAITKMHDIIFTIFIAVSFQAVGFIFLLYPFCLFFAALR